MYTQKTKNKGYQFKEYLYYIQHINALHSNLVENVLISVKDTGIGIPDDKMQLIFERFGQVDKTLSRNNEGSGIGLSLVKSLISMNSGTINVKSEYGVGSEFIINSPVKLVEEKGLKEPFIYRDKVEIANIEFSDI